MGKIRKIETIVSEHKDLKYFYYKNEWNIHDGKSTLYVVKDKELIEQLDKNKLEEMSKKLNEALANMTQEDIDKYFLPDTRPKGWLSIEEYLPMMYAIDIMQGYTLYKVKDKDGNEFESAVSDHNVWYYMAKNAGITHWWNGE